MRPRKSFTAMAIILGFGLHPEVRADEKAAQPETSGAAQTRENRAPAPAPEAAKVSATSTAEEVDALRREVEELKKQLQRLRDELRARLLPDKGPPSGVPSGP